MPVSRTSPPSWTYTDGNANVTADDIVKKAGGYYKVHPNGQEELIHCLRTLGDTMASIIAITDQADGTYSAPETLSFSVQFSENVTVVTTGGTPSLQVYTDAGDVFNLSYASGSGTDTLVFSGTLVKNTASVDDGTLVIREEVQLNGGTIKDSATQNSNNYFPAAYTQPAIVMSTADIIDVTNPADGTVANDDDLTFVVEFDKAVTLSGSNGVFVEVTDAADTTIQIPLASGDGTDTLTFTGPATAAIDGVLTVETVLALGATTTLLDANSNPANLNFPVDYEAPAITIATV